MQRILGVVLAGGESRRFGPDKAFAGLGGLSLIALAIARSGKQVHHLAIAVGRNSEPFAALAHDVILDAPSILDAPDADRGQQGPLAGILAALAFAESRSFTQVVSIACDTPFFPLTLVATLEAANPDGKADAVVATCNGATHRIFCLWRVACRPRLEAAFAGGLRKMEYVARTLDLAVAEFPNSDDAPLRDPFFNINTPEDLAVAERYLKSASALLKV